MEKHHDTPSASQLDALLEQMRKDYLDQFPHKIAEIERLTRTLQETGGANDTYDELYRLVHSISGTAGTYGLHAFTTVCHQFEDFLAGLDRGRAPTAEVIGPCLRYVELLSRAHRLCSLTIKDHYPEIDAALADMGQAIYGAVYTGLIVHPARSLIGVYSKALEPLPLHLAVETDGLTALDRLLHEKFDLLILGKDLATLNAEGLIAAVRLSRGINSEIHMIMLAEDGLAATPSPPGPDRIIGHGPDVTRLLQSAVSEFIRRRR